MTTRLKRKFIEWALLFFAFFPIIPNSIKGLPVILLLLAALPFFDKKKINFKLFIIYSFLYFLYLMSLCYTSNIPFALKKLETGLSILVLPLIFFILAPDYQIKNKLKLLFIRLFVFSTTIFSMLSMLAIVLDHKTAYYKNFYSNKYRIVVEKLPLIGQHPIYASLFLAIAILFTLYLYNKEKKTYQLILLGINSIFLLMLSSKGVIISLMILFFVYIFFRNNIQRKKKIFLLASFFIMISLIFMSNRRMKELLKPETYNKVNTNYSNSYRIAIIDCSIKAIKKNWLIGYGVGDAQDILNACYINKSKFLLQKTYNSHNQYFDIWLKTGILGLIYFLFFIAYITYISYKNKNYLLTAIILLFSINFLFENILDRQSGVILFYFLIIFLMANTKPVTKVLN